MTGPIFNQTMEILLPQLVESIYSTEVIENWDDPVYTPVGFPVSIQPANSTEGDIDRPQVITGWVLITPPGTDIPELQAKSKVRFGGVLVAEIVGAPARWPDPWKPGQVHHVEATLEVVSG